MEGLGTFFIYFGITAGVAILFGQFSDLRYLILHLL